MRKTREKQRQGEKERQIEKKGKNERRRDMETKGWEKAVERVLSERNRGGKEMREWIRGPGVRAPPRRVGPTPTIPRHQRTDSHRVYAALTYIQSAFTTGETAWRSNKRGPGHARRPTTCVRRSISLVSGIARGRYCFSSDLADGSYDLEPDFYS